MIKALFDTNVILDVLMERSPFYPPSAKCVSLVSQKKIQGFLAAHAITTIEYLLSKHLSKQKSKLVLEKLLDTFAVAAVSKSTLLDALNNRFSDYEDSVTYCAAVEAKASSIITRDIKGFKHANIETVTPKEFLSLF